MSARLNTQPRSIPKKAQGQWGLGYREPLNANERSKRDDDPLNVRQRIIDIYSKGGFDSIDPGDMRGRFRWMGLYTQRKQGIPGGKTATLEPEELEDKYFMLRIRIDGGALTSDQARVVADIATQYGRDIADVSDRANIQLHWIRIEDVPAIWDKLDAVGLTTTEACGDCPRVMIACPLEGVAEDSILDSTAALRELVDRFVGNAEFSNLPRKYKTSISGCAHQCVNHEINDCAFVGVIGPEGKAGYDLWVGGGLSVDPRMSERIGVFVREDQVTDVWIGVTSIFRDYGYRRQRNHARLKFLIADWGPEKFREVLETEYLGYALADGKPPAFSPAVRDHTGVHVQNDGLCAVGATTLSGRTSGSALRAVADLSDRYGKGRVRLTLQQGIVVLDVEQTATEALVTALGEWNFEVRPSAFQRGTIACTGIEFCKLALTETKQRSQTIRREMDKRMPGFDTPITIHVNGCPNSCARFQVADIGFKGMVQKGPSGDEEAFQVHLGGRMGSDAEFGRKLRGLKVTAEEAPEYIERVLTGYLEHREGSEPFASYVSRADEAWLL